MGDLLSPAPLTLLTGAAGWFGRAWLSGLADPHPRHGPLVTGGLRALAATPAQVPDILETFPDAEVFVGDLADPATAERLLCNAEGADLVHGAGVIHPDRVADFDRVNAVATEVLLRESARAGIRRFVHVSSNSPFGVNPTPVDRFRHEEPFRPYLSYGLSKARAEAAARTSNGENGMETVVIRPPWFYGPWQPVRQTTFFSMVAAGRFPVMGTGTQVRSMVYVDNLVQGAALAARVPGIGGGAFWVADDRPYSILELVETVRRVLRDEGYHVAAPRLPGSVRGGQRIPAVVGRTAERVDRMLQRRGRYHQKIHVLGELDKTIACDISHTIEQLGYRPAVDLAEGMRTAIRWCEHRGITVATKAGR